MVAVGGEVWHVEHLAPLAVFGHLDDLSSDLELGDAVCFGDFGNLDLIARSLATRAIGLPV